MGTVFAVGLLASGLASTSVGAYAGSEIMAGLLHVRVPLLLRRAVTLVPALVIIGVGAEPTWALVLSQVVLSFGIPLAIVPLMRATGSEALMGRWRDGAPLRWTARASAALIIALNVALVWLTLPLLYGQGGSPMLLLSAMSLVWGADIAAYFTGRALGGRFIARKLAPSVSPNKSWEGALGGCWPQSGWPPMPPGAGKACSPACCMRAARPGCCCACCC